MKRKRVPGCVLGVDPGLGGALAFLYFNKELIVYDMPILRVVRGGKNKRELDHHKLHQILSEFFNGSITIAFVERVSAMPGQGVTSMFSFGFTYGSILQCIVSNGIVLEHIHPKTWRKVLSVRKGKDGGRMRASELMPQYAELWSLKKHHGRAEAALIAYCGAMEKGLL